ncbi:MAG: mechanosensitive ion channel family protein [Aigarchaeota archaeon]|nr:mechanosensitive ion channel family protein [Candidatus Geocrenenecus dongiae]
MSSNLQNEELSKIEIAKKTGRSIAKLVVYIIVYIAVAAVIQWFFTSFLLQYGINLVDYIGYVQILLALAFGYLIVSSVATFFYWSIRGRYGHPTAVAVRNIVRIVGLGALISAIAGGVAGGAAGVALGGFLGMVIGFASQQVLGQSIAGLFLLISRPFRISDEVILAGEEGVVEDVSTLFTILLKNDGSKVLIPNNVILGGKIYVKPKNK